MKKTPKTLSCLCALGGILVVLGYLYDVVSISALILHLLLLTGVVVLSVFSIKLCDRVELLEGLVYRLALKVGRIKR